MTDRYIVRGGGFYIGVYNSRTDRYSWVHKANVSKLKRTESYLLTEEQANTLKDKNDNGYVKMANVTITKA